MHLVFKKASDLALTFDARVVDNLGSPGPDTRLTLIIRLKEVVKDLISSTGVYTSYNLGGLVLMAAR